MTWDDCKNHNKKYYGTEFFKFTPSNVQIWYSLLKEIENKPHLCELHLNQANKQLKSKITWEQLVKIVQSFGLGRSTDPATGGVIYQDWENIVLLTDVEFEKFRKQIRDIVIAKHPTQMEMNF